MVREQREGERVALLRRCWCWLSPGHSTALFCVLKSAIGFSGFKKNDPQAWHQVWFLFSARLGFHCDISTWVFWKAFWRIWPVLPLPYGGPIFNLLLVSLGTKPGHLTSLWHLISPIYTTITKINLQYLGDLDICDHLHACGI